MVSAVVAYLAVLSEVFPQNITGIEACMGDQGCGIKRHFITGQGEIETGCFASDSLVCACR